MIKFMETDRDFKRSSRRDGGWHSRPASMPRKYPRPNNNHNWPIMLYDVTFAFVHIRILAVPASVHPEKRILCPTSSCRRCTHTCHIN